MKRNLLLSITTIALSIITLTSCHVIEDVYYQTEEYCCGEVCCKGYEAFQDYFIGYNTSEVTDKQVGEHIHKQVTTVFHR